MNDRNTQVFKWAESPATLPPGVEPMFDTRGDVTQAFRGAFAFLSQNGVVDTRKHKTVGLDIVVTKGNDKFTILPDSLGNLTGQPGAGKSVSFAFKVAREMQRRVVISMPYLGLAKSNASYMRTNSRISGVPLYEDYDFSVADPCPDKGAAVVVTTPAVVHARYVRDYLHYDRDILIVDEVQVCDTFTYALVQLARQRRIAYSTLLASATPDAASASRVSYERTANYSQVREESYAFQHYSTWRSTDSGKPWNVRNIKRSTLIFNDDPHVSRKLCLEYEAAGVPAIVVTSDVTPETMETFYTRASLESPCVVLADSTYSSGYTFRVLDVIDCARVCALFVSPDGSSAAVDRRLAVWERVQRKGRAARTEKGHVGTYFHPDSEVPLNARFKVSPEHVDSAFVLVRLLGLAVPDELSAQTEHKVKVKKPSVSDLNWLFSKFQLGFNFSMMSGDSRISGHTPMGTLARAFYCFVTVPQTISRPSVKSNDPAVARAFSCFNATNMSDDHTAPRARSSGYSAAPVDQILSKFREPRCDTTTVKYDRSSFYIADEYPDDIDCKDVEAYVHMVSRNPEQMELMSRLDAFRCFASVLYFMGACALQRALCVELLEIAQASGYMAASQSRADVARWRADLVGYEMKWRMCRDLTPYFDSHRFRVSVVPISPDDIKEKALSRVPSAYIQEWREAPVEVTSKQICDSIPEPPAATRSDRYRPSITYRSAASADEYKVILNKATSSRRGWKGLNLGAHTWYSPGYESRHRHTISDSSVSSGTSHSSERPEPKE
jgi:hypothetical protein